MGFGAIAQPATGGPTEGVSLDACLLTARATGADGDAFKDTSTGNLYAFWQPAGTPGWLVPGGLYGKLSNILSNASGRDCYVSYADAYSDLTDRGWVANPGGGTPSKTVGNPLIVDSGTSSSGYEQMMFTPSSGPSSATDVFIVCKLAFTTLPSTDDVGPTIDIRDGSAKRQWCSPRSANAGQLRWRNSGLIGETNIDQGTAAAWVFAIHAGSATDLSAILTEDPTARASGTSYTDFLGTANNQVLITAYNSGGATQQSIMEISEFAVGVLS